ncbi:hypothetical protein ACUUL3_09560 [Thiovibrio sp. JS02]
MADVPKALKLIETGRNAHERGGFTDFFVRCLQSFPATCDHLREMLVLGFRWQPFWRAFPALEKGMTFSRKLATLLTMNRENNPHVEVLAWIFQEQSPR